MNSIVCAKCGARIPQEAKFCPSCGAHAAAAHEKLFCFSCGTSMQSTAKFCPSCGHPATQDGNRQDKTPISPEYTPKPESATSEKSPSKGLAWVFLFLCLIATAVCAGALIWIQKKSVESTGGLQQGQSNTQTISKVSAPATTTTTLPPQSAPPSVQQSSQPAPSVVKAKTSSSFKFIEYKDSKYGCSLMVPEHWNAGGGGDDVFFSGKPDTEEKNLSLAIAITVRPIRSSVESQLVSMKEQWQTLNKYKLISQQAGFHEGRRMGRIFVQYEMSSEQGIWLEEQVVVESVNHYYRVGFKGPQRLFEKYRFVFEQAVSSLHIM